MPPLAANDDELRAMGFKFRVETPCTHCGGTLRWWTNPTGRWVALDKDTLEPHTSCPFAERPAKGNE